MAVPGEWDWLTVTEAENTCFTLTEKIDFIRKSSELLSSVFSLSDIITFGLLYTYWLQVSVLPVGLVAWFLDSGGYYVFFLPNQ